MRKVRCLAAALLLVFLIGGTALAVEDIALSLVTVRDSGTLEVIGSSGYTSEDDMNFTASTENGELEVSNAVALRNEGTSWFVILEYGSDNKNDKLREVSDEVMKGVAAMVLDIDDGALIPCADGTQVNVQKAQPFRDALNGVHGTTKQSLLPATLNTVMNYISDHRANLMPNVAVIIITQARILKDTELDAMQETLTKFNTVTTHVVCPLPASAGKDWKDKALRVAQMGAGTLSGSGYITRESNSAEAAKAVENIRNLERSMIMLLLKPTRNSADAVGQELSVTQTTAGGKQLTVKAKLTNETLELWRRKIEEEQPAPVPGESEPEPETMITNLFNHSAGTLMWEAQEVEQPPEGLSMELIIGIGVGVLILALVIVLIAVRHSRKKDKKTATTAYGVPAAGGSSGGGGGGPQVTLRGDDGSLYTGTMKNNRLIIGRDARKGAMLAIQGDGKLSGVHVMLEKQGGQLLVTDQNSLNGTKINGTKITGSMILNQNDSMTIGSHTYTVTWRG